MKFRSIGVRSNRRQTLHFVSYVFYFIPLLVLRIPLRCKIPLQINCLCIVYSYNKYSLIFLICIKMSFFNIRRNQFYFINLHIFARLQIKSNVKTFQSTIHSYQATQSFLSLKSTFLKQLLTPTIVRFSMHFHLPENNTSYIQEGTR